MRIKEIRMQREISQRRLAAAIGVAPNTLSQYENEKRVPDPETIERIADFLNVSLDCLFGREEKKTTPGKGGGPSEMAQRFMPLVDRLTPEQQQLLLTQIQAWIGQNELLSPVVPQSSEGKAPGFDP